VVASAVYTFAERSRPKMTLLQKQTVHRALNTMDGKKGSEDIASHQ